MIESIDAARRASPAPAARANADPIHGHEWDTVEGHPTPNATSSTRASSRFRAPPKTCTELDRLRLLVPTDGTAAA